jgi:hypothetical protein
MRGTYDVVRIEERVITMAFVTTKDGVDIFVVSP